MLETRVLSEEQTHYGPDASNGAQAAQQPGPGPYTNWEHLSDELQRLNMLIHAQMLRQRRLQQASPMDYFRGLVLTEEEVTDLLADVSGQPGIQDDPGGRCDASDTHAAVARLDARIGSRLAAASDPRELRLPRLSSLFGLSPLEQRVLVVCLAPEVDRRYEKLYAYLQDDVTRKKPSVDLALNLLCDTTRERLAARGMFEAPSPLCKHRLLQITESHADGPSPLLSRFLKLDDRVAGWLLRCEAIDARLEQAVRLLPCEGNLPGGADDRATRLRQFVRSHMREPDAARRSMVFHLCGQYGSGRKTAARMAASELKLPLLVADLARLVEGTLPFEESLWLLGREALLQPAALCLENFDTLLLQSERQRTFLTALVEMVKGLSRLTFLVGSQPWKAKGLFEDHVFIDLEFPLPGETARRRCWEQTLLEEQLAIDVDVGALASKFRFTPGQVRDAVAGARTRAAWGGDAARVTAADLYGACRDQSNARLGSLARKIEAQRRWEDIVLPHDQMDQLREICDQARTRHIVYGNWGFDRKLSTGKGLNVLFSGSPGTGKTMAAEVIASELGLDLYKIDLSQVVSKYIGETEKNLHQIFNEAQTSQAILFFDEADALFGKRSEVKDAHDRYANIEIGYLLQRMEEYDGIAILATNLRQNMDDAFVRRLQFIIEFPFPDEEYRRRIWEVTFPPEAPRDEDVDFERLGREIRLAGGNIKNIVLAAAFYAAAEGGVIHMSHLWRAARREMQKLGRSVD